MTDGRVIRLFWFRPARAAFDEVLRGEVMPDLAALPGIEVCYSARQGPDELGPRLIVSIWDSLDAMVSALGPEPGGPFHPEYLEETTDREVEIAPILLGERYAAGDPPSILRVLSGRVRDGELARYVSDVRAGLHRDVMGDHGPVALYLAESAADAFVTVSAWRAWTDVEAATGGDIRRPTATKQPERLDRWDVQHFEIVEGR